MEATVVPTDAAMTISIIQFGVTFFVGGALVPTWMFLHTMSLIVHLPLMKTNMPANAHFFLVHYLDVFRMRIEKLEQSIDKLFVNFDSYKEMLIEEESTNVQLTDQLKYSHYKFNIFRNLSFYIIIFMAMLIVLLMLYLTEKCMKRNQENRQGRRDRSREHYMVNIIVRFFYEIFYEVALAALINFVLINSGTRGQNVNAFISFVMILLVFVFVTFIGSRILRNGPWIADAYRGKASVSDFLGMRYEKRRLNPNLVKDNLQSNKR